MARKSRAGCTALQTKLSKTLCLAGLYGRLSDEDGDDIEQNSIGNQKKIGLTYLTEHSDIQLVDFYTDNGYTGMNYNRPGFKRMLLDIQSGRINCVIVKDISRLGRHFVLTSEFVERKFPELGIRLISINDDYDSLDEKADAGKLTLPLKMVMNDYYVKDISRKIRSSITAKMEEGKFLPSSGSIPYGYLRNSEENTFSIDPEAAPIVKKVFELRAAGMKFNAIAKKLNLEEIPSPGKLRFVRGMTKDKRFETAGWIRGTIRKITSDPVYLGNRIHGKVKRDKVGMDKTRRPENEWQIIKDVHPSIISQELYDTVQRINQKELETRSSYEKRAEAGVDYRELFKGKLVCGDCGSIMVPAKGCARPNAKTPSRIFYDCNNYKYSNHAHCSSHYIRQETVMNAVTNQLNQQVQVCVDVEKLAEEVLKNPEVSAHQDMVNNEYTGIVTKRRNVEAKMEQLLVDLTERLISRDEYLYMKERYAGQLEELLIAETKAMAERKAFGMVVNTTQKWMDAVKKYQKMPFIDRDLIDTLIESIEIYGDRHIKINLNYVNPYEPLLDYLKQIGVMLHAG